MSNIVEADYTIVQERTLPVIIGEIKIIEQNVAKTAMEGAIQIGQRLQEAKEQVGHGNFDAWCKENLNYNRRTAERFMKIATEYGGENGLASNATTLSHLSISNALSLLKLPEEDRGQFIENHPVEDMTNKALEDEIRRLKEEAVKKQEDMDSLQTMAEEAGKEMQQALEEAATLKQRLAAAEAAAADPKELDELRAKLQKAKEDLQKNKEKLKQEEAGRQEAINAAVEESRQAIIDAANKEAEDRMRQVAGENSELRQQLTDVQRKLEAASHGSIIRFKLLTDQLQDIFDKCGAMILEENDTDVSHKMEAGLKQIVQAFHAAL